MNFEAEISLTPRRSTLATSENRLRMFTDTIPRWSFLFGHYGREIGDYTTYSNHLHCTYSCIALSVVPKLQALPRYSVARSHGLSMLHMEGS